MILSKHIITSLLLCLLLVTTVQSQFNESDIENIVNLTLNAVDGIDPEQAAQELIELAASVPKCGDCYCIPDNDTDECPGDPQLPYDLEGDMFKFIERTLVNPMELDCDPFSDSNCETIPPREFVELGNTAVCGIQYNFPQSSRLCPTKYKLQSYPSWESAEADGAVVTHVGACGVCSSLSDLSVFLSSKDLPNAVARCAVSVVNFLEFNILSVLECLVELGLTEQCANLFLLNGVASLRCNRQCQTMLGNVEPAQGPAPECELNNCLSCLEDAVVPVFRSYGGRDPNRSGIWVGRTYPCSETYSIKHVVCPKLEDMKVAPTFVTTKSPTVVPTTSPTTASTISTPEPSPSSQGKDTSGAVGMTVVTHNYYGMVYGLIGVFMGIGVNVF